MASMEIYIQSKSGDYNLERKFPQGSCKTFGEYRDFEAVVKDVLSIGGYYTTNRKGNRVFVPLHEIEYIEDRTPAETTEWGV